MKKIEMLKLAGSIIVSVGVGSIVNNLIKCTTSIRTGKVERACIVVAGMILVSMISDKAVDYTEKTIDNTITSIKKMVDTGDLA